MSPLEQLIMKKMQEGKKVSPLEQQAKLNNLEMLKEEMRGMMKDHLGPHDDGGSDESMDDDKSEDMPEDGEAAHIEMEGSPEALKMGLDKAKEAVDMHSDGTEDSDNEHDSSDEHDMDDHSDMGSEKLSPEEMKQLQMLLAKMKA